MKGAALGVSVIVTDDLASFRNLAEKLEVEHQVPKVRGQVCQFHVRRWVGCTPAFWLGLLESSQFYQSLDKDLKPVPDNVDSISRTPHVELLTIKIK